LGETNKKEKKEILPAPYAEMGVKTPKRKTI
jgi:hypothetical protein